MRFQNLGGQGVAPDAVSHSTRVTRPGPAKQAAAGAGGAHPGAPRAGGARPRRGHAWLRGQPRRGRPCHHQPLRRQPHARRRRGGALSPRNKKLIDKINFTTYFLLHILILSLNHHSCYYFKFHTAYQLVFAFYLGFSEPFFFRSRPFLSGFCWLHSLDCF